MGSFSYFLGNREQGTGNNILVQRGRNHLVTKTLKDCVAEIPLGLSVGVVPGSRCHIP